MAGNGIICSFIVKHSTFPLTYITIIAYTN